MTFLLNYREACSRLKYITSHCSLRREIFNYSRHIELDVKNTQHWQMISFSDLSSQPVVQASHVSCQFYLTVVNVYCV